MSIKLFDFLLFFCQNEILKYFNKCNHESSQILISIVWTSKHHLGRVSKTEKEDDIIFFSNARVGNDFV